MPTAFEHLRKSNENRSAIEHLALGVPINPPPNAWLVTMYFYTALHLVEKTSCKRIAFKETCKKI